jgi:3-oxoadipate enol-lactonase
VPTATIHGVSLAYCDAGQGTPLVLAHGFPLDHGLWSGQIEALSRRCRVIAPDLRGFGQSAVPEGTVTMEQYADDLAGLLDHLGISEPVVLGGLSMGGYVAFAFWRKHAARLRGLVLCDTRAAADTFTGAAARRVVADRVLEEGALPVLSPMISKLFSTKTLSGRHELAEWVRRVIERTDPRGIAAANRGMAERPDSTADLPRIGCPALLLAGEEDSLSPPGEMRGMAEKIPHARFVVIPSAAHLAPLEQPAAVNRAMEDFLQTMET